MLQNNLWLAVGAAKLTDERRSPVVVSGAEAEHTQANINYTYTHLTIVFIWHEGQREREPKHSLTR